MALLTEDRISRLAVALLVRRLSLVGTVSRVPQEDFRGGAGDTVTVRVPERRQAGIQTTPGDDIAFTDISEDSADVTVVQVYDATTITDHDQALNIESYGRQILRPLIATVAEGLEEQLTDEMNDAAPDDSFAASYDEDDTRDLILKAREELTDADVPPEDRFFACSPQIATRVLRLPEIHKANERGSSRTLTAAQIGQAYGFTFVENTGLADGTATVYHRSGFALATFPTISLDGPDGDQQAVVTEQGLSIRTIRQWNPTTLSRQQVVTAFSGAGMVDADRVFKLATT